jgi:hypothetical protein
MGGIFGGGGGGGAKAVKPPKPIQLKVGQLEQNMVNADEAAYTAGDQYVAQYYPALAQARDSMIGQAYQAITGPLDPTVQNAFVNTANRGSINAFGGGDQSFGLGQGSLARNAAAASVAQQTQGYQDTSRAFFENLNTFYAPRSFGMTPTDAANIYTFNNTQYNNYLQQQAAANTQAYYQNVAASNQQAGATAGLVGSIGSSVISAALPAIIAA